MIRLIYMYIFKVHVSIHLTWQKCLKINWINSSRPSSYYYLPIMSACMMHEVICKFKHWFIYRNYTKNEKCIGTRHTRLICVEFMYLDLIYIYIYINIQSCHSEKCFLFAFINVPINFQLYITLSPWPVYSYILPGLPVLLFTEWL